jgi:hypothetical protein
MRWLTAAVELLPEAVERQEPPPQLRERLLAAVEADARESGAEAEAAKQGILHRAGSWLAGGGSGPRDWRRVAWLGAMTLLVVALAGYEIGNNGGETGGGGSVTYVSGHSPGVTAEVVREGSSGEIKLAAVGKLPPDRVLEAWVRRDGEVEPVTALFVPNSAGEASTVLGDMKGVDLVMVTTEPTGGSRSPTSDPIAEVPVA